MSKEKRFLELINSLLDGEYKKSELLSNEMNVSSRTIRNDIKELNCLLKDNCAEIITKPKLGIKLKVNNEQKFNDYFYNLKHDSEPKKNYLVNHEDRSKYLLSYLLNESSYVKIDDLSEKIYVSKSTLTADLKAVRKMLEEFNLTIITRPNYGIIVSGSEFNKRLCIAKYLISFSKVINNEVVGSEIIKKIEDILLNEILASSIRLSDVAFRNLVIHIYISIIRINKNYSLSINKSCLEEDKYPEEVEVSKKIISRLEKELGILFPKNENEYVAIHLAGKKIVDLNDKYATDNIVISSEINNVVNDMLDHVYESLKVDFRSDFELIMMMSLHLISLKVRLEYDMPMKNPLLNDIKSGQSFAYMIANQACDVLSERYNKSISEDEVAYFALHFSLALERKRTKIDKKNVLIVCSSGRGSAKLLIYKIKSEFGSYINNIETADLYSLKNYDFTSIDYVISTLKINFNIPRPILEVNCFFEPSDLKAIKKMLIDENESEIIKYFDRELFFTDMEFKTREEVLSFMCKEIEQKRDVPKDLYEMVIKREKLAVTEFGNMVSIPHPYKAVCNDTFVSICILKKPIIWEEKKVQLVFLMCIENNDERDLKSFYQITSKFLTNKCYITELIKKKDYSVLNKLLSLIEEEEGEKNG